MIESPVGSQATEWEAIKDEMADELGEWAKTLELAIKGFVGTAVDRPEKVMGLLYQVKSPWIRCGYDYSHYLANHDARLRITLAVCVIWVRVHRLDQIMPNIPANQLLFSISSLGFQVTSQIGRYIHHYRKFQTPTNLPPAPATSPATPRS